MAAPSLTLPRRWVAALLVAVVVAVGAVVVVRSVGGDEPACTDTRVEARSPLLDVAGMAAQPDERLDVLVGAIEAMEAPFGDVVAGVGYDYDQWLRAYGVAEGILTWTKNNAPVTLLDADTLEPRWSLKPAGRRTAWDASVDRFLLLDLDDSRPTTVSSYAMADGGQVWCSEVESEGSSGHRDGDPVSTAFLDGGDVLVALPGGEGITLTRLAGKDGEEVWRRPMTGIARADYLGALSAGVAVSGGVEEFRLADPPDPDAAGVDGGDAITAFSTRDGEPLWSWGPGPGAVAHVVGVGDGRVIVVLRSAAGIELLALDDEDGSVLWQVRSQGGAFEATLRGAVVLTKSPAGLVGYDARTGEVRWRFTTPTDRTYFPYGFTLAQMPSLDQDHVLLPTTTSLGVLDVNTGTATGQPLPTDGVSTTYWPYQVLVTENLIGVITNTGGVLARREVAAGPTDAG